MLALEIVREHLSNTVAWVSGRIESTPGAALNKIMRKAKDSKQASAPPCRV